MQKLTDTQALNTIAAILGANSEWSSEMLEWIADVVGQTKRPHPGDTTPEELAGYRAQADALGIWHDGEDDE